MNFMYRFPVVKGIQAGREYYISMVPLKLLSKLFPNEEEIVLPEYRAQRKINEMRIPDIKKYILENRETYVFSALSASIDGEFTFIKSTEAEIGILEVNMDAVFLINDGQHRKAAILAAIEEDITLLEETISIVFFRDDGLSRSQQMFADLNKHAVKTSNSLATLYDSRNKLGVATNNIVDKIEFFKKYTDKERDNLGKNSSKLFTLNNLYKANFKILKSINCDEEDQKFLYNYWKGVSDNIVEWQELMDRLLGKKELRENYIITLAITLSAFGKLGRYFYENQDVNMDKYLVKLKDIDWSRNNRDWIGKTLREDGKVANSDEAINSTCMMLKKLIGLSKK